MPDVEAVYWALEAKGYRGADAIKALPELMEALAPARDVAAYLDRPHADETDDRVLFRGGSTQAEGTLTVGDIRRLARLLDRLAKKGDTDDAA